uniref:Protein CIP2A n=1 Tax=Syphacia muris TaxID=451379 RepID=A0A0N5A856_9BILA
MKTRVDSCYFQALIKLEKLITNCVAATQRLFNNSSEENACILDKELLGVIRATNDIDPTARLSLKNTHLRELLTHCPVLLSAPITSAITRSRLHLMLFNLAFHNIQIRRYLAGEQIQICGPVFECLRLSLREQLGPQNLIDILRLLQVLTYERCLTLGIWTNELISFLLSEVNCSEEPEWMPYCMAILCNLASRSKSVCQRVKKSTSYKAFCHKLLKLLAHDSRIVVVSALVLVGYLDEKLRDTVFCTRNIPQTFQCVFNVLVIGDCLMTRHIAADLLKRLVVSDIPIVSSTPVITSTGKYLVSYPYFEKSIQMVARLLGQIDHRTEESMKIYDILLSFCSLSQMRKPTALAVLKCAPTEQRLTTPIISIYNTAKLSFEEAIIPDIPLNAMRLLRYLLKEAIENGSHVEEFIPVEHIMQLIENSLKTSIETNSDLVTEQCRRISEGLRLAETVSSDDDLRADVLEVVTAPLCSHIVESQMISNPIVVYMGRPAVQRQEPVPNWSVYGVDIVLELSRVLAALKDYSKMHKDQYWKLLKDDRLVPFIAYAVANGNPEMTYKALLLYTHCAQVQAFSTKWLGDLIASCTDTKSLQAFTLQKPCSRNSLERPVNAPDEDLSLTDRKAMEMQVVFDSDSIKQVDELLSKMKSGMDLNDPRVSHLVNVFERKIMILKSRERELEQVIASREDSLRRSERLRLMYSSKESESDLSYFVIRSNCIVFGAQIILVDQILALRGLLDDYERKADETSKTIAALKSENDGLISKTDMLRKENDEKQEALDLLREQLTKITDDNKALVEENKSEREFSTLTKARYDELKVKFEQ